MLIVAYSMLSNLTQPIGHFFLGRKLVLTVSHSLLVMTTSILEVSNSSIGGIASIRTNDSSSKSSGYSS